ncbi:MAG: 6,7-dimethyl-8-ribityllumazine synthase [Holophagales bacterium]|nr:6,7-dimethyl-8-ribityllumazine synthase [Holophagales bacterium]
MSSTQIQAAIVAADFNKEIVEPMIRAATDHLQANQARIVKLARVSGAYEVPLVAQTLIERDDIDLLVVVGYIERGETLHGEVMGHVVHQSLVDLQLRYRKVIGLGIIGPGATLDQARERHLHYARAAADAAVRNRKALGELEH